MENKKSDYQLATVALAGLIVVFAALATGVVLDSKLDKINSVKPQGQLARPPGSLSPSLLWECVGRADNQFFDNRNNCLTQECRDREEQQWLSQTTYCADTYGP